MRAYYPHGTRLPALEQNILKYRALEMATVLFYVEHLKHLALGAVRSTDIFSKGRSERLPEGTKNLYKKLWAALVADGVISEAESVEIQKLISFRDDIGHNIHELTFDLGRDRVVQSYKEFHGQKYDYNARERLKHFLEELPRRFQAKHYVFVMSLDRLLFESPKRTYRGDIRYRVKDTEFIVGNHDGDKRSVITHDFRHC